jgi:hypothetical protein
MTKIVVDAAMRSKLRDLAEEMQFTDEAGRVLGNFTPWPTGAQREPQISEEELDRRERAGGGRSLKEILADLEKQA